MAGAPPLDVQSPGLVAGTAFRDHDCTAPSQVDLLLFYTALGGGTLGESWSVYSYIQALGCANPLSTDASQVVIGQ